MNDSITKTDLVRKQIANFLKEKNGEWIRQKDIISELQPSNPYGAQEGVYRGVFNKIAGIGGTYIPIPHVEMKKEGNKAFYRYVEPDRIRFSKNSSLYNLVIHLLDFEKTLKEDQLFNIDLRTLDEDEMKLYLEFINQFKSLKGVFFKEEH